MSIQLLLKLSYSNGVVKMSSTKKLIKNKVTFNGWLALNIPMMLIIIDITKKVAPGKYQKLKPLSLYKLVNIVV